MGTPHDYIEPGRKSARFRISGKWKKPARLATVVLAAAAACIALGWYAGQRAGRASLERLALIWPAPFSMPQVDRADLARMAQQCRLHQAQMDRKAVVSCLKEGAQALDAKEELPHWAGRLDALLRHAP